MTLTPAAVVDAWLTPPQFPLPRLELPPENRTLSLRSQPLPSFRHAFGQESLGIGKRSHASIWGASPKKALLVHGWGGEVRQFGAWIGPLLASGYEVWGGDAPAHGRSEGRLSSAPANAALLVELAREARAPFDLVVAHSLGAIATTLALAAGLSARRVVFLAPCCFVLDDLLAVARKLGWPETRDEELLQYFTTSFSTNLSLIDALPGIGELPPLTIFHDPRDESVPLSEAQLIAAHWPGAILRETPRVGHSRILFARKVIEAAICEPDAVQ